MSDTDIAVIGLAGKFPGAADVAQFWRNLRDGVEGIRFFSEDELSAAGVSKALLAQPNYVRARGYLDDAAMFDASFFGMSPREAEILDVQHRLFLECAWEAMEHAGYNTAELDVPVGVYAGVGMNSYLLNQLMGRVEGGETADLYQMMLGNDKDFLATRVAYKLDLRGPSMAVQTACSTSLVAIHLACQSLLSGECDMAMAGGVTVTTPQEQGYLYQEGMILSPDGHCRAFDADAGGTVGGDGVGIVVLKRLEDAREDGDFIWAVVKGSAINNDGAHKIGYTAPSQHGQTAVIEEALALADLEPRDISYIEAHGTGTKLGDPIEMAALMEVFGEGDREERQRREEEGGNRFGRANDSVGAERLSNDPTSLSELDLNQPVRPHAENESGGFSKEQWCAIGSVKTNVGHLDTAAGVTGFIKTVLALHYGEIPASLHFKEGNREIGFAGSPFFVNDRLRVWERVDGRPRRAGVSSFGIGGTNAHVVLEEGKRQKAKGKNGVYDLEEGKRQKAKGKNGVYDSVDGVVAERLGTDPASLSDATHNRPVRSGGAELLVVSARSEGAVETAAENLAGHLEQNKGLDLGDVAFTLGRGRRKFGVRRFVVARSGDEAAAKLRAGGEMKRAVAENVPVAFLFPGQGTQRLGMGVELYNRYPLFKEIVDGCEEVLGWSILEILKGKREKGKGEIGGYGSGDEAQSRESKIDETEFAQVALFVVEVALARLVMSWGVRPQAMLGHSLGEFVAACVAGVFSLEDGVRLVALRGRLMQSMKGGSMISVNLSETDVRPWLRTGVELAVVNGAEQCVLSGETGVIEALGTALEGAGVIHKVLRTSHAYHSAMMEPAVAEFVTAVGGIELSGPEIPYISNVTGEVITAEQATDPAYWGKHLRQTVRFADGLGNLLTDTPVVLLELGPGKVLTTLAKRHGGFEGDKHGLVTTMRGDADEEAAVLEAVGQLWQWGAELDWNGFWGEGQRVPLPTYPFERQRYWVQRERRETETETEVVLSGEGVDRWFYLPSWERSIWPQGDTSKYQNCLVFVDGGEFGDSVVKRLRLEGRRVIAVRMGSAFTRLGQNSYGLNPADLSEYRKLLEALDGKPSLVVHGWLVGDTDRGENGHGLGWQDVGFLSVMGLMQALGPDAVCDVVIVGRGVCEVTGSERLVADKAAVLGAVRVIPQEYEHVSARFVDVDGTSDVMAGRLVTDVTRPGGEAIVAYRGRQRWVQRFVATRLERREGALASRQNYLITGGLGGVGYLLAEHLARTVPQVKLALMGRSVVPSGAKGLTSPSIEFDESPLATQRQDFRSLAGRVNRLCAAYVVRYFGERGIRLGVGTMLGREALREKLGLLPKFERFFDFFIRLLTDEGILTTIGDRWQVTRQISQLERIGELTAEIEEMYPETEALLGLIEHCVGHYGAALSGEMAAIEVLYPNGQLDLRGVEQQEDLLSSRMACIEQLRALVKNWAGERPLRILEVGGGNGLLTRLLAEDVRPFSGVEYTFTDISRALVLDREKQAAQQQWDFMRFAQLDIGRDPVSQGMEAGRFDLIVGLDVVHIPADVRQTVGHLQQLLASGGRLCLLESLHSWKWVDMIWGLAADWWGYSDTDLRQGTPLLTLPEWGGVMEDLFPTVSLFPNAAGEAKETDFGLVIGEMAQLVSDEQASKVNHLIALGAEVEVVRADVAQFEQVQAAVRQIEAQWGRIHGVIHAAAATVGGLMQMKTAADVRQEFAAATTGTEVLDRLLGEQLELFLLCSSITAATGGIGQAGYSASNAFLDAYAQMKQAAGRRVISVNWDRWSGTGMAVTMEQLHEELTDEALTGGMQPSEGQEAFDRILGLHDIGQIVVSTQHFPTMVREARKYYLGGLGVGKTADNRGEAGYERPSWLPDYVGPRNETEEKIGQIWQDVLGIGQVSIEDDFSTLGGDSLIALRLVSQLKEAFDTEIQVRVIYDYPTVAGLAEWLDTVRWLGTEDDLLAEEDDDEFEEGVL